MAEPEYEVVWPLGKAVYEPVPLAQRQPDLSGATICELWDWLFKGEEIFPRVREELSKKYASVKFVDYTVFGNTRGPHESRLIENLSRLLQENRCTAVISGIGA